MSPRWSDALRLSVVAATLPIAGMAAAQTSALPTVCAVGQTEVDRDEARDELAALLAEIRRGLTYYGHDVTDAGCAHEATLTLTTFDLTWRAEVRAGGQTRRFAARRGAEASTMAPDIIRHLDEVWRDGVLDTAGERPPRRGDSSAPERGTQWFPTIGFVVGGLGRSGFRYTGYYYRTDQLASPRALPPGDQLMPTSSPSLGMALRLASSRPVSAQLELQLEHRGTQQWWLPWLLGAPTRATYLSLPAMARFRFHGRRPFDRHVYVGALAGWKLGEHYAGRVAGIPIYIEGTHGYDMFGDVLFGGFAGVQVERPPRVRQDGSLRRREVDVRFAATAAPTEWAPRYGGELAVRWRFGR